MYMQKIYSVILVLFMFLLSACGTDNKENPPQTNATYGFFNVTTPLKIHAPSVDANGTVIGGAYKVTLQLLEFGLAKSGESIQIKPFDLKYGFMTNPIETTDSNGFATFTYNAPEKYSDVRGQEFTIKAIYLDPNNVAVSSPGSGPIAPSILLTQEIVLQFQ